jgi:activating signal cointegrator complex subunit 2
MKAEILRRAEEMSENEEEDEEETLEVDFDAAINVKVAGDGESTDEEEMGDEAEGSKSSEATPKNPETILELAYIRDPKLFDRDANTRRSKARQDLKAETRKCLTKKHSFC